MCVGLGRDLLDFSSNIGCSPANTNAEGELKHMLATGKRSESIELFLTQHIGERVSKADVSERDLGY
jgi:hypothetical protein